MIRSGGAKAQPPAEQGETIASGPIAPRALVVGNGLGITVAALDLELGSLTLEGEIFEIVVVAELDDQVAGAAQIEVSEKPQLARGAV